MLFVNFLCFVMIFAKKAKISPKLMFIFLYFPDLKVGVTNIRPLWGFYNHLLARPNVFIRVDVSRLFVMDVSF